MNSFNNLILTVLKFNSIIERESKSYGDEQEDPLLNPKIKFNMYGSNHRSSGS